MPDVYAPSVLMGVRRSVVEINESVGTTKALCQFFDTLSPEPDAAFVVVRSAASSAEPTLADLLPQHTDLPIRIVTESIPLSVNHVYLSPPGQPLLFDQGALRPVDGDEWEGATGPMLHVFRSWGGSCQLAMHSGTGLERGRSSVPVMEYAGKEAHGEEQAADPRVERLETELRETQRELREMVQEYERTQRRLWSVNEALQTQNELLRERTDQVQSLSEALTRAEEKERKRLSHVLHDDLQQILYAVRTKLDLASDDVGAEERSQALLTRALEMLDEGIDLTRTLATDLNPPVEHSLWDTLEWLAIRMQETHGLSVELRASGQDRPLEKSLRVLVVRLVRELLFNVIKHAGTDEATLRLRESDEQLYVTVADRGNGFAPAEVENGGGFGLTSVRKRIELVGGTFEVDAAPEEGTRVVLGVPYHFGRKEEQGEGGVAGCSGLEQRVS